MTAIEDDGGIELTRSEIEKIFARGPLPPGRRGNGTPIEDDGGGSMVVTTTAVRRHVGSQKIIAAGPLTPHGRRGTGLRSRTMGVNDLDIS
jgi:hypothetical protein